MYPSTANEQKVNGRNGLVPENVIYVSRQLNARNDKVLFLLTLRSLIMSGGERKTQSIPHKVITKVNMRRLCGCSVIIKD